MSEMEKTMAAYDPKDSIDKTFREALSQYEEEVPPHLWEKIEAKLVQNRRTKIIRIYLSLAASIALIISMGIGYYLGQKQWVKTKEEVLLQGKNHLQVPLPQQPSRAIQLSMEKDNQLLKNQSVQAHSFVSSNQSKYTSPSHWSDTVNKSNIVFSDIPEPEASYLKTREGLCEHNKNKSVLLAQKYNPQPSETKKVIFDRIYISFSTAPLYAYRIVEGVPSVTLNQIEKPTITYSTGINAIFARKRLLVSLGLFYTQMAIDINNVQVLQQYYQSNYDSKFLGYEQSSATLINSSGTITPTSSNVILTNYEAVMAHYYPNQEFTQNGVERYDKSVSDNLTGTTSNPSIYQTNLNQKFNYLEIPLTFQYNFFQQRVNIGIQTGLNVNYLISNAAYAHINGKKTKIGDTKNIRTFNIAGSLGISVSIPLSSRLSFSIEPRARYYLLSINRGSAINTHPYSFGIYTGIMIRY